MTRLGKTPIIPATAYILFLLTGVIPYDQQQLHYFNLAEAGEAECIDYDSTENTIAINCNASFLDVVQAMDDPDILENLGNGEYILNANLEVADDITFEMDSNQDGGLQYLKIAGESGIIVHGTILIDGVRITSWDASDEDVIQQDIDGSIRRAYIQFDASEGSEIINSEFGYLGYQELGKRGFDLWGPDASYSGEGSSHDMQIRGSEFHDMWFAFYSRGAYNIVIDGNEYHHNIKYALDPHSGTRDMNITNNWLHHNPIGAICSDRCSNILIEGNRVEHNTDHGIFFSRNMYDSIVRNNHVSNTTSGVTVSESPNNQIYNNTIEGASSQAIRLFNPPVPDDGLTESNLIYNNIISSSEDGISAARSHDNILESNTFSDIESREYSLSGDSSMIIRGQHFNNALIAQEGSATENVVEIVDSGIIEVTEGETDGEDDDGSEDEEEGEGNLYNTDNESFRRTLDDGDSITVNTSSS
ncbi:MAG TPA: right-handed parallel beta-helix repeat-containing protein [Nitrososphaera sp.]